MQLHSFLRADHAASLMASTTADDMSDELGADNAAGVNYEAGVRDGWRLVGPVHKQRFATCTPATTPTVEAEEGGEGGEGDEGGEGGEGPAAEDAEDAMETDMHQLEEIRRNVMASDPFRRWLSEITKCGPSRHRSMVRRFRCVRWHIQTANASRWPLAVAVAFTLTLTLTLALALTLALDLDLGWTTQWPTSDPKPRSLSWTPRSASCGIRWATVAAWRTRRRTLPPRARRRARRTRRRQRYCGRSGTPERSVWGLACSPFGRNS